MKTRERIDLALIDDNPWQPRLEIDQEALQGLADSIDQMGLLQAPLGRRDLIRDRIQLAFGHRRVAACRLLQEQGKWLTHVEIDIDEISNERMAVMALTENVARAQLTQIEVVRAHRRALDETEHSIQSLADQLRVSRSALSNNLRVLDLPYAVLEHVESGDLTVSVAREFLALRNSTHVHIEDMREVIRQVVNASGPPDWRRRHVRKLISERVSYNEQEYRPLGPKTGHSTGGGHREATFDVDAFAFEHPDALHTIPGDDGHFENYQRTERYDQSRLWTCEVREWSRRQTRATREANQEADASGNGTGQPAGQGKGISRDKLFEQLLANDPVWKEIVATRAKKGPNRPVSDEEKAALGTRAEFKDVSYDTKFWKILQVGNQENAHNWQRRDGGHVPPWFPDLGECQRCVIGASYAKSNGGYPLEKPALVCFNRGHYDEKYAAGEAAYREKLEAQRRGIDRQDRDAAEVIADSLLLIPDHISEALAFALLSADPALEWEHPFGRFHPDWSREPEVVALVREIIGAEYARFDRSGRTGPVGSDPPKDLPVDDVRQLTAALITHHLRQAGKIETVSRETVAGRT